MARRLSENAAAQCHSESCCPRGRARCGEARLRTWQCGIVSSRFNASTAGGLAAVVLWSTTFAIARSLSEQVGALTAAAAVYLTGGFFCLARLRWAGGLSRRLRTLSVPYLLGCGCLFIFYTALIYSAVGLAKNREQLLEVALVNYLWPAATILLSLPLLGQKAHLLLGPATFLALAGVVLVMTQGSRVSWTSVWGHFIGNPAVYVLALLGAIAWALYSVLARRWTKPGDPGAVESFILAAGLVLLVMRLCSSGSGRWTPRAMAEALALGTITALAYTLWDTAMRKGNLTLVVAFSYFTPLLSTLLSCIYLHVMPGPKLWLGCCLIVSGSLLTWCTMGNSASPAPDRKQFEHLAV